MRNDKYRFPDFYSAGVWLGRIGMFILGFCVVYGLKCLLFYLGII